jgi:hypothetical protein
LYIIL